MNQPAQALIAYEQTLSTDPNRFRSVYGAAKAADQTGDLAKATSFTTSSSPSWEPMRTPRDRSSRKPVYLRGSTSEPFSRELSLLFCMLDVETTRRSVMSASFGGKRSFGKCLKPLCGECQGASRWR